MAKLPEDLKQARAICRREARADPQNSRSLAEVLWALRRAAKPKTEGEQRSKMRFVWVFNGGGGSFPSGVFSSRRAAEEWIAEHELVGTLTRFPVGTGSYDWAIKEGIFTPHTREERSSAFIATFSALSLEQHKYRRQS